MKVGRPIQFNPDKALENAMQVFWRKGYESTSLQMLLKAMNLSKSSFYQNFGSKHQIFERCIIRYRGYLVKQMMEQLKLSKTGRQFIEDVFYSAVEEASAGLEKKGCLLINTASEFAQKDAEIAKLVSNGTADLARVFKAAIKRAQQEGDISIDKKPDPLANYLVTCLSGFKTMVKGGADEKTMRDVASIVLAAFG